MTTVQPDRIDGDRWTAGLRPAAARRTGPGRAADTRADPATGPVVEPPGSGPLERGPVTVIAVVGLTILVVIAGILGWRAAVDSDDALAARGFRGEIVAERGFRAIAFAPDGVRVLAATGPVVEVWHVSTHRRVGPTFTGHTGRITAMALSPNGRLLATVAEDGSARLWDATTGRQVDEVDTEPVVRPTTLAFSPDATRLAVSGEAGTALWDVEGRRQVGVLDSSSGAHSAVAFGPDGTRVATGEVSGAVVTVWDVATRRPVDQPLTGHLDNAPISALAFDSSGTRLVDGSGDKAAFLYDTRDGQYIEFRQNDEGVINVILTPDGRRLITSSIKDINIWDVASVTRTGRPVIDDGSADVNDLALGPDGDTLAVIRDHRIQFWSVTAATGGR